MGVARNIEVIMRKIRICGVQTHYKLKKDTTGKEYLNTGGVDLARLINPLKYLDPKKFDVDIVYEVVGPNCKFKNTEDLSKHYDILYFSYMDEVKFYLELRVQGLKNKMKIAVDVDDNLWAVDPTHPFYKDDFEKGSEKNFNRSAIILDADSVTTTSDYLKKRIQENTKVEDITVIPNFVDLELYDYKKIKPKKSDEITIGYIGGSSHFPDMNDPKFVNAMTQILNKYPNVRFKTTFFMPQLKALWGYKYKYALGRADVYRFINELWVEMMSECDFFIAPLSHSSYSSSKSYIKALEYGAGKKAVILERIEPYQEFAGENPEEKGVFLAYSTKEWFNAMEKLVLDEKLRKENGEKLYNEVKKNHTIQGNTKVYEKYFTVLFDKDFLVW